MIDHIGLFVADAAKRADFYEKLLAPLGYVKKAAYPTAVCFANDEDGDGIWLESPKDGNPVVPLRSAPRPPTPSRRSMRRVSRPAAPTTASPVRARTTGRATMPRSSMIPMATTSRPCSTTIRRDPTVPAGIMPVNGC